VQVRSYRGKGRRVLDAFNVEVGDQVTVKTDKEEFEGILMPRYEFADEEHIVIKLKNGYNIGIKVDEIRSITIVEKAKVIERRRETVREVKGLPKVKLIGTGGTIASRVDYRTGGVSPAMSVEDLYTLVPELREIASLSVESLFNVYSENMTVRHWEEIAKAVYRAFESGFNGIVIAHGTDTMHYTASALSFALENPPGPVVLVGAQRSSDRPSSDAATNLISAVKVASHKDISGVFVSMHLGLDDGIIALHRGVRVRKNHTSRRDAFKSIDEEPPIIVQNGKVVVRREIPKTNGEFKVIPKFSNKAYLLKFFPNQNPEIISYLVDKGYEAIILEGTGLGHVSTEMIPYLKEAVDKGIFIGMTSQCIWGSVRMTVYETGRELLKIGVTPLGSMLAETALVKAMWLLGQGFKGERLAKLMVQNLRGEMVDRRPV